MVVIGEAHEGQLSAFTHGPAPGQGQPQYVSAASKSLSASSLASLPEKRGDVELYALEQWGHVWPGPHFTGKLASDDALKDFDAAEIIWEFFQRYQREL